MKKKKTKKRQAKPLTKEKPPIPDMLFCRVCDSYTEHYDNICQSCGSTALGNQQ